MQSITRENRFSGIYTFERCSETLARGARKKVEKTQEKGVEGEGNYNDLGILMVKARSVLGYILSRDFSQEGCEKKSQETREKEDKI